MKRMVVLVVILAVVVAAFFGGRALYRTQVSQQTYTEEIISAEVPISRTQFASCIADEDDDPFIRQRFKMGVVEWVKPQSKQIKLEDDEKVWTVDEIFIRRMRVLVDLGAAKNQYRTDAYIWVGLSSFPLGDLLAMIRPGHLVRLEQLEIGPLFELVCLSPRGWPPS